MRPLRLEITCREETQVISAAGVIHVTSCFLHEPCSMSKKTQSTGRKRHKAQQCRAGRPGRPHQAGFTTRDGLTLASHKFPMHHARPLELPHAVRHPGHADASRHQVDDGLDLDCLLRHSRQLTGDVVRRKNRVVQRRQNAARKNHQGLIEKIVQRAACSVFWAASALCPRTAATNRSRAISWQSRSGGAKFLCYRSELTP